MGRIFRFEPPDHDTVTHLSPWPDWFATQEDCHSVCIFNKATDEEIAFLSPAEWGTNWAWNLNEEGTGIVLRRTQ